LTVHQVAPRQTFCSPSTVDVGVDALTEAGISEPPQAAGQHRTGCAVDALMDPTSTER